MDKKLLGIALFISGLIMTINTSFGQADGPVAMADTMRSEGKIYVVVAVIVTIFIGLIIYLISLDKKISKMEKESD